MLLPKEAFLLMVGGLVTIMTITKFPKPKYKQREPETNGIISKSKSLRFHPRNATVTKHPVKRKVIFIVGQGRTGSTMLGNIFNQLENVVYMFEPLRAVESEFPSAYFRNTNNAVAMKYHHEIEAFLTQTLSCTFTPSSDTYLKNFDLGRFRQFSKALSSPPFCSKDGSNCTFVRSDLMNKICRDKSKILVLKELIFRVPNMDLSFLEYVARKLQNVAEIILIHLLRDPRAYLLSMQKLNWFNETHADPAKRTDIFISSRCRETYKNLVYYKSRRATSASMQYVPLRFEDFAEEPERKLLELFNSVQMKTTDKIKKYVKSSTETRGSENVDPYKTSPRNSRNTANKWRKQADWKFVDNVQYHCWKMMSVAGYKVASSRQDMLRINKKIVTESNLKR